MSDTIMDTITVEQAAVETMDRSMENAVEQVAVETNNADSDASEGSHGRPADDGSDTDITTPDSSGEMKRANEDIDGSTEIPIAKRIKIFDIRRSTKDLETGPKVFGIRRQAVCESLPYFNSYNSSLYTQNGIARGFYMNKEARAHDIFKAQVIISNIGGGRVRDEDTGAFTRVDHQSDNTPTFRAFQLAKEGRILIPVIVGRNHPFWPIPAPHNFSVLDYFMVTDIWAELSFVKPGTPPVRVWCARLEKVDKDSQSWWDHNPSSYVRGPPCVQHTCSACNQESKEILQVGWTCLNHLCGSFFRAQNGNPITSVAYNDAFLQERQEFIGPIPALKPELPEEIELNRGGLTGSESIFRDGIVCPLCGCCSSRRYWSRWSCENTDCTFEMETPMRPYPKAMVNAEVDAFDKAINKVRKTRGIRKDALAVKLDTTAVKHRNFAMGLYEVSQFLLPDPEGKIIGSVTVFRANATICQAGPDAMFDELSTTDLGLRRNVVSARGSMIEGWTRHFAQNWGAKYKFGVDVQSKGFDEAPDPILKAVHRLKWAGTTAVPGAAEFITSLGCDGGEHQDANVEFNECLSLGYMEADRIKYHDDGEKELGPTVATLSLGSPAMMAFRPKKKSGMNAVVSEAARPKAAGKDFQDVLTFPLYHGDMLIMHGTKIHRYYEHMVAPCGNRRFALTCRLIEPTKMKNDAARQEALIKGTMPAHAAEFVYNGDVDLAAPETAEMTEVEIIVEQLVDQASSELAVCQAQSEQEMVYHNMTAAAIVQQILAQQKILAEQILAGQSTVEQNTVAQNTAESIAMARNNTAPTEDTKQQVATVQVEQASVTPQQDAEFHHAMGRYNLRVRKTLSYKDE